MPLILMPGRLYLTVEPMACMHLENKTLLAWVHAALYVSHNKCPANSHPRLRKMCRLMYKNDNCNLCEFMQNSWHTLTNTESKNFAKALSSSSILRAVAVNSGISVSNFVCMNYVLFGGASFFFFFYHASFHKLPATTKACL